MSKTMRTLDLLTCFTIMPMGKLPIKQFIVIDTQPMKTGWIFQTSVYRLMAKHQPERKKLSNKTIFSRKHTTRVYNGVKQPPRADMHYNCRLLIRIVLILLVKW